MKSTNVTQDARPRFAIAGLFLLFALVLGPVGCQDMVWVAPDDGSVQQGAFNVQVYWSAEMVPSTLRVALNNEEITGSMAPASMSPSFSAEAEIAGVRGMVINPFPGKKLLSAQMNDTYGLPHSATSIFTAASSTPREAFAGGAMVFECTDSFLNSPIQVPGFDMDLGVSELLCKMIPISGIFPAGTSAFPVDSDPFPVLFSVFPEQVTFDLDDTIPNGISLSPVELALSLDFDPGDPSQEGNLCGASFVMEGTVLPVESSVASRYHAAMTQTLRDVSLSFVSGGECVPEFTSPEGAEVMTFNYLASK